jgi:hypothetical protein
MIFAILLCPGCRQKARSRTRQAECAVGIDAEGTGAEVAVDNSTISNNGTGLFTSGMIALDVSNSNIAFNAQAANGAWFSFGNAASEGKAERHIRLLATLAFVAPGIIAALINGTAPADLTVTGLARALPYSWAEQERLIGLATR